MDRIMRRIIEIAGHSVFTPGLQRGGWALDAGANRGRFGAQLTAKFPLEIIHIEPNPALADYLRQKGRKVVNCALEAADGTSVLHIGENDETSSVHLSARE